MDKSYYRERLLENAFAMQDKAATLTASFFDPYTFEYRGFFENDKAIFVCPNSSSFPRLEIYSWIYPEWIIEKGKVFATNRATTNKTEDKTDIFLHGRFSCGDDRIVQAALEMLHEKWQEIKADIRKKKEAREAVSHFIV